MPKPNEVRSFAELANSPPSSFSSSTCLHDFHGREIIVQQESQSYLRGAGNQIHHNHLPPAVALQGTGWVLGPLRILILCTFTLVLRYKAAPTSMTEMAIVEPSIALLVAKRES